MSRTLFSFGHGYSAQALSAKLIPDGWTVFGTTRQAEKAQQFKADGVVPHLLPDDDIMEDLRSASHLLISAGPDADGDPMIGMLGDQLVRMEFEWIGYLSTTGVYGDHNGGWVDETTPLEPTTTRGKHRVLAEQQWTDLAERFGFTLHIFRLAGIYGPGRGPFSKVRSGTARRIIKENQVFSRIHVEDIARVLSGSIRHPNPGAIYNVCDDLAAPPQDVIAYAAELLGMPVPPAEAFENAEMSPMARSFYAESKRVRNDRIKEELGITLAYPDYKSGLSDLLLRMGQDASP
ncbi:SDR family oxidoreductase [Litoreibacter roseus]|uniref:NAD(P)-dependent oxidoreductase n=1 Tax=Litoreibacter roseus TaxID=2601869 RepID=A0A6N6JGE7_9RHOB|nr:SDR family oxidoreductase [Litoreibacter roseus]GFE64469.1 NAD(P)-dependent oxidoreductase [Litoreibacter roseus]